MCGRMGLYLDLSFEANHFPFGFPCRQVWLAEHHQEAQKTKKFCAQGQFHGSSPPQKKL
jgi:hypothetical protein